MTMIIKSALAIALSSLAACGPADSGTADQSSTNVAASQTHSAKGTVDTISGLEVTISHGPVESLGWPAMTMGFTAGDPSIIAGIKPGDQVNFTFSQSAGGFGLTSIARQ